MYLVVDSGSTKTDWFAIDNSGNILFSTQTLGLNPAVLPSSILKERIINNYQLEQNRKHFQKLYFYGAGCGVSSAQNRIKKVFKQIFTNCELDIKEDTYAAVYATVNLNEKAIVCIMGTGSNCTFYDGSKIEQRVVSLGYVLMDDASGNFYGKQLIRGYYFNEMPKKISQKFELSFDLSPDTIKEEIYRKENPNKYLAGFAKFLIENKNEPYIKKIIYDGLRRFIKHQILQFDNSKSLPIHFVGSISFYLKEELKKILIEFNLNLGKVVKRPIDGLVSYHKNILYKSDL